MVAQNTTPITNSLELLTPKFQTLLTSMPQNYCKLLLKLNSNLNYLLSRQDTNQCNNQLLNKINMKTKESSSNKLNKIQGSCYRQTKTIIKHGSSYEKIKNTQQQKDRH